MTQPWPLPWEPDPQYRKRVAYFSMEYAIDQPLKIYSGGLGFLAGSHMRSAFDLRQNLIGIGMLWKNGYYDQVRHDDQSMRVQFQKKYYRSWSTPASAFQSPSMVTRSGSRPCCCRRRSSVPLPSIC